MMGGLSKLSPSELENSIYHSIPSSTPNAPISFASSLSKIPHRSNCIRRTKVFDVASPAHTIRGLCCCMGPFDIDKQVCLELLAQELVVDAFFCLLPMIDRYGLKKVLADGELNLVVCRYDFLASFYNQLNRQALEGDTSTSSPPASLPPLQIESYDAASPPSLPRFDSVLRRTEWEALCIHAQKNVRLHYLRDFAVLFDSQPLIQCLAIPDFLFGAFKISPKAPSKAAIRLNTYLDTSVQALTSVMAETDFTKDWVPYFRFPMHVGLEKCDTIKQIGRVEKVTRYHIVLPWPWNNVEVVLHGWLVNDLDTNDRLVICFRSMDDEYRVPADLDVIAAPTQSEGTTRLYVEGGCQIRIDGAHRVRMEMLWNIDLKMSIPAALVKFVAKTFVKVGINSLKDICSRAQTDSKWIERRVQHPWLYEYINHHTSRFQGEQLADSGPAVEVPKVSSPAGEGRLRSKLRLGRKWRSP